jgi:hypothetical protein
VRHFRPAFICVCTDDSNKNFFLSHLIPPFYFCDARFSRLPALSPLALRFIAAIISTSPSVKPRVVILHITASQLTRSIASLLKARAVPNVVAHVTAGKERGFAEFRSAGECRKPKLSILSFGGLAETVAGRNICNIRPAESSLRAG